MAGTPPPLFCTNVTATLLLQSVYWANNVGPARTTGKNHGVTQKGGGGQFVGGDFIATSERNRAAP